MVGVNDWSCRTVASCHSLTPQLSPAVTHTQLFVKYSQSHSESGTLQTTADGSDMTSKYFFLLTKIIAMLRYLEQSSSLSLLIRLWCIIQCSETVSDCSVIIDKLSWLTQLIISVSDVRGHWRRRLTTIKMSSFKPKLYRSQEGCCICKAKSSRWEQK